jgi:hypothetical protein
MIPINGQSWIICGGRDFTDQGMFDSAMSDLIQLKGMPARVIEGGALGADTMAREWAKRHSLKVQTCEAFWHIYGRSAGVIRNQGMLRLNPHLVVAFPGGRGTADMVRRSRNAGVDVAEIKLGRAFGSVLPTEGEA